MQFLKDEFLQALDNVCNDGESNISEATISLSSIIVECEKPPSNHCDCHWSIIADGRDVTYKIPESLRNSSMETKNTYSALSMDYDEESYEYYEDGFDEKEWIERNKYWLNTITTDEDTQKYLFREIQKNEFTGCAECGGCI